MIAERVECNWYIFRGGLFLCTSKKICVSSELVSLYIFIFCLHLQKTSLPHQQKHAWLSKKMYSMLCWKLITMHSLNSPSIPAVHGSSWHLCQGADNVMAGAGISAGTTSPQPVTDTCLPVCRALARRTRTRWESRFPSVCLVLILNNLQSVL